MSDTSRCGNNNHSKMNVAVRFCPDCGNVVGPNAPTRKCDSEIHAKRRKERNKYCVDCGKLLATSN